MADPASDFGRQLARKGAATAATVSAEVVDLTSDGRANLDVQGQLVTGVACPDSYRSRAVGDWVAVRMSAVPVVLWRLGDDPGEVDPDTVQEIVLDTQVVAAASWGTAAPTGTGWQTISQLFMRKNANGQIELYGQVGSESDTSPTQPGRPPSPKTISPSDSGSWRNGSPDNSHSVPMQGDWTGRGNLRGAWFYGSAIEDACSGKTVAKMTVQLSRRTGAGVNGKRPVHLYLHNYGSAPSGQLNLGDGPEDLISLSVGAQGTAVLSASWRNALASGSAKGLAIYSKGPSDYMAVTGGKLTITFSA
jgi:hypothetical protein